MIRSNLRHPILAIPMVITALMGLGAIGIGIAAIVANTRSLGLGVGVFLIGYGLVLICQALFVGMGHRWVLGLMVASSLLHLLMLYSFATAGDTAQLIGSVILAPFVLAALITSVVAWARDRQTAK